MNSIQRVRKAIDHEEPDRMPIDLGSHFSTGISVFGYQRLREHLGLPIGKVEMVDCIQGLARVDEDVLERMHVDTMLLNPPWPKPHLWNPRDSFNFWVPEAFVPKRQDGGGWRVDTPSGSMIMPAGGFFFDGAWHDFYGDPDGTLALFAARAEKIHKEYEKFTIYMGFSGYFNDLDFACDMLTDPDDCRAKNELELIKQIESFDKVNQAMGCYLGAVAMSCDLGIQSGLMVTPSSYEDICYPYLRKWCKHVHETSDIKIFMHSCGSIYDIMDQIVDAGIDIINPVQISAAKMDPARLKREFGSKICFWGGGCDTQNVLWKQTPEEIAAHVSGLIDIFKPGGGFVFNQVHNIMGNVPPENIVSMYDTAYANSLYS
jgi:uroporphyrinogen decarboxylase